MDKRQFTKLFLEQAGMDASEATVAVYMKIWWVSPRSPIGLRLTFEGAKFLKTTLKLQSYSTDVKAGYQDSLKLLLWMNKYISSPFYFPSRNIDPRTFTCFGETDAIMMAMMSGDLAQYLENFAKNNA